MAMNYMDDAEKIYKGIKMVAKGADMASKGYGAKKQLEDLSSAARESSKSGGPLFHLKDDLAGECDARLEQPPVRRVLATALSGGENQEERKRILKRAESSGKYMSDLQDGMARMDLSEKRTAPRTVTANVSSYGGHAHSASANPPPEYQCTKRTAPSLQAWFLCYECNPNDSYRIGNKEKLHLICESCAWKCHKDHKDSVTYLKEVPPRAYCQCDDNCKIFHN